MDDLAATLTTFIEPVGIGALFALAIWGGVKLALAGVNAAREVALARIATERAMADAVREQAAAMAQQAQVWADLNHEAQEQGIILRLISQRVGLAPAVQGDESRGA